MYWKKACTLCFWEFKTHNEQHTKTCSTEIKEKEDCKKHKVQVTCKGKIRLLSDCDSKGMEAICLKHRRKKIRQEFYIQQDKVLCIKTTNY